MTLSGPVAEAPTRLRILLVEDDDDHAELVTSALRRSVVASFEIQRASSASEALALLDTSISASHGFNAVLLDYELGDSKGPALLQELRARGLPKDVPALMVTSHGSEEAAVAALRAGAADYLPKSEGLRGAVLERSLLRIVERATLQAERDGAIGELERSDARFRALVEKSAEAVSLVNAKGIIIYASPSTVTVLGHRAEDRLGRLELDLVHPDDLTMVRRRFLTLMRVPGGSVTRECRGRHKDGSWRWVECTLTNLLDDPDVRGVVVNYRDITERREAADAERRRVKQAEQLAAVLAEVGAARGLDGALAALSHGAVRLLRGTAGTVHAMDPESSERLLSLSSNTDGTMRRTAGPRPIVEGSFGWRITHTGESVVVEDYRALDPATYELYDQMMREGNRSSVNVPIKNGGRVVGTLHVDHGEPGFFGADDLALAETLAGMAGAAIERAREETARTEAEAALRACETRYRAVIEHSADGVTISVGTTYALVNPASVRILGVAGPAELIGKSITTFVHPADRAMVRERAERRQRGEDVPSVYEYRIVRPSGEERTVEISATAILYDEQSASLAIVRDITERKRAEAEVAEVNRRLTGALMDLETAQQRLVQQERLRALGEMAAGIAHDLNNALSPVVGFSDLLLSAPHALTDPDRVQTYLGLIRTGAQDAAGVVARLREFYRPREGGDVLVPVDLAVIVEQAVALTAPKWKDQAQSLGRTIHVETDLAPVSPAAGVEAELRELLTNLIFNAADALPRGGTVTVRTRQRDGQGVLEVADTGTGMDEETRRRCLEPFFSTKGEKGTGLGLSMVHGTVRRHKGEIEIESAPGRGTIFRIVLPLWGARELEVAIPVAETAVARPLSVLVVDDEPSVRQVTMAFLKHDGHRVECAADGYEALRILRTRPADLVVTDRAMPGMSGEHLATMVKEIWPATAIVLLTGFGDLMDAAGEHPRAIDAVLGKPVTMVKLRETVARVVAAGLQDKDAQETPALAQLAEAAAH